MYSNDIRKKLIDKLASPLNLSLKQAAKEIGVSYSFAKRCIADFRKTMSPVRPEIQRKKRSDCTLSEAAMQYLRDVVESQPDRFLNELSDILFYDLQLPEAPSCRVVSKALKVKHCN